MSHLLIDYHYKTKLAYDELGWNLFYLMKESITQASTIKIVSDTCNILDEDPCGFSLIFSLNESHVTLHSYHTKGLLAVDVFVCGSDNDPKKIIEYFEKRALFVMEKLDRVFELDCKRFH